MPTVPSGVLYFMVWKYALYGGLLFIGSRVFQYFGVFDIYPLGRHCRPEWPRAVAGVVV